MDAWDLVADHVSKLGSGALAIAGAVAGSLFAFCLFRVWLMRRRSHTRDGAARRRAAHSAEQLLRARRWQPAVRFPGAGALEGELLTEALLWIEGGGTAGAKALESLANGDMAPTLALAAKGRLLRQRGRGGRSRLRHAIVLRALTEPARALVCIAGETKLLATDPRAKAWAGVLAANVGERGLARQLLEEVVRSLADAADTRLAATAIVGLAALAESTGEHGRAIALYVQSARLKRVHGDLAEAARASEAAGRLLAARRDWPLALDVLAGGFEDARRTGDTALIGALALAMAPVAAAAREQAAGHAEPGATGGAHLNAA